MRQFVILYKRLGSKDFSRLEPHVHAKVYNRAPVLRAIDHMRANVEVEAMSIRLDNEMFNVVAIVGQETLTTNGFRFDDMLDSLPQQEPVDRTALIAG